MWGPSSIIQGKAKISVTSMKLHFITFEFKGPRSISKFNYPKYLKQKFRWPLWNYISLHLRSKVHGQLSKVSKAKNFGDLYFHENTLQVAQKNSTVNTIQLKYDVRCKKLHFFTCAVKGPRSISKVKYPKYLKQKISVTSMKLHFITFEVKGPRSKAQGQLSKLSKAKNFGDLYEITLHYIWGQRSKVNYPKYLKQKISVTSIFMKTHFKWHKKIVQSIQYSWNMTSGARNYTSLHLRSKVNYPRKSKKF